METDTPARADRAVKAEDDSHDKKMPDSKPKYKSWKKKYRKMRVVFEEKMREGENLYKLEQKALQTANRLAVENDRLLDLLLQVNNSPQIPPEKRIDLSLDPSANEEGLSLPIDHEDAPKNGTRSYRQLLAEVPHFGFATAAGQLSDMAINDLNTGRDSPADPLQGAPHPPTFLTADDIDNYTYEIDVRVAARQKLATAKDLLPTLAPLAGTNGQPPDPSTPLPVLLQNLEIASATHGHPNPTAATSSTAARDLAIRNPTSVYNWLRKHAPKVFLQDHETSAADHHAEETSAVTAKGARASRGGGGDKAGDRAKPSARARKTAGGSSRPANKSKDAVAVDPMDLDDDEHDFHTPSDRRAAAASKRKRVVDDDPGYRPKGGSSKSRARKRKSTGGGEETTPSAPPAKKAKKGVPAVARHDTEDEEEEGDAIIVRGQEKD